MTDILRYTDAAGGAVDPSQTTPVYMELAWRLPVPISLAGETQEEKVTTAHEAAVDALDWQVYQLAEAGVAVPFFEPLDALEHPADPPKSAYWETVTRVAYIHPMPDAQPTIEEQAQVVEGVSEYLARAIIGDGRYLDGVTRWENFEYGVQQPGDDPHLFYTNVVAHFRDAHPGLTGEGLANALAPLLGPLGIESEEFGVQAATILNETALGLGVRASQLGIFPLGPNSVFRTHDPRE